MTEEPLEPNMALEYENRPTSPKCLNLSTGAHLNESPQTAAKMVGGAAALLRNSRFRRKQPRPRRRSGDYVAQDLRKNSTDECEVIDYSMSSNANPPPKPCHDCHPNCDLLPLTKEPSPYNITSEDGMSSPTFIASPPNSPQYSSPINKASPPSPEEIHACSTPPTIFPPFSNGFGQTGHWPGLTLGPAPIFGRHRAQHSAPRGGPPRAWSNADLTEALHNVWNKKMTTSQASRIFGIPYNSLLMYVRGKYGKSLKLDLLKKGLDMALENKNNKKSKSSESHPPEFNAFAMGLFGEYPPPFPFATALSHILPPPPIDPNIDRGKTEDLE
ncbi:unnamed protein product [Allacma fusca]|uniref:HTH psq-type domain-containing protein n=1 Tax=Allacma fusca TaxID=39272 RepID=A0A8J2JLW9_9HEXA|nr:unnamed protein product [Allacma fusca]